MRFTQSFRDKSKVLTVQPDEDRAPLRAGEFPLNEAFIEQACSFLSA
jgi:hypothetical protein